MPSDWGRDFGVAAAKVYLRTTYGQFEERFNQGTLVPNFGAEQNFTQKRFLNGLNCEVSGWENH